MVIRKCPRCGKAFNKVNAYTYHINRKFKCKLIDNTDNQIVPYENDPDDDQSDHNGHNDGHDIQDDNVSNYSSSTNSSISSHNDKHPSSYTQTDRVMIQELKHEFDRYKRQTEKKIDYLKTTNEEQRKQIDLLQLKDTKVVNTSNKMKNSNNTINNIVLVNYGNEDMNKIDKNKVMECIKRGAFQSTVRLTDVIHFDPDHPENHNIYISNMKNKYAMEYKNNGWHLVTKTELIDKIYRHKREYIEDNLEEFYKGLNTKQKESLDLWLSTDEEHDKIKKIKHDMLLLLFNKRQMVLESRY